MAWLHENIPQQNAELFYAANAKRIGIWAIRRGQPQWDDCTVRVTDGARLNNWTRSSPIQSNVPGAFPVAIFPRVTVRTFLSVLREDALRNRANVTIVRFWA